jgi:hypothetical protein
MDINKTINDLWPIAPEWVNFIAVDFDGNVGGYEYHPDTDNKHKWWRPNRGYNCGTREKLTDFGREFPNWGELIFERPLSLPTTDNQLTPLLQKLRNYLDTTPRQQIEADWAQVKSLGLTGSPNCEEFIKSFKSN